MNKNTKVESIISMVIGAGMIGWWTFALINDQMPEIHTAPTNAAFHLSAEYLTGFTLIAGGIGLILNRVWGRSVHYVSLGMLLYAVIKASGFYAQQGDIVFVAMFALFTFATLFILVRGLRADRHLLIG